MKINGWLAILLTITLANILNWEGYGQVVPKNYVIVVLGSSTAEGTGPSNPNNAWVKRYQAYLSENYPNFTIINLAVGGFTTYNILPTGAYIDPSLSPSQSVDPDHNITKAMSYSPDAIIINLPTNDCACHYPVADQIANYASITNVAYSSNVPVWVCTPQPNYIGGLSHLLQLELMDQTYSIFGNLAVDFWTTLATADGKLYPEYDSGDGYHVNDEGHRIFYERILSKNIPNYLINRNDNEAPTTPTSLTFSNLAETEFQLHWNSSSDNVAVTGYEIYRNGLFYKTVTNNYATISGLSAATNYTMTVLAKDAQGNKSSTSAPIIVTTLDNTAPSAPTNLSYYDLTESSFTLSWNESSDNIAVTGYKIFLDGILKITVDYPDVNINGLSNNTKYIVTISAFDAEGNNSILSNSLEVTTSNTPDSESPDIPSGLTSSNISGSGFTLSWTATHDNVGVSGYDVYRNGTFYSTVTGTSCVLTGLSNATTYSMRVLARDAAGNVSGLSNVLNVTTLDTQAPSIPTGLAASNITTTSFILSWTASTDNVSVANYSVYRNGTLYSTVSGTSATITGLTNGTTYGMSVLARDGSGNVSARSGTQNVTTLDTDPPSIPASLTASNISGTGFTLTWAASTDNVGVSSYDVFINGSNYSTVTGTTINITGLSNVTTYSMSVKAKDATGNESALSNILNVTTLDSQPPTKPLSLSSSNRTGSSFTLSWLPSNDNVGVTDYQVYRNGTQISIVTGTSAVISGLSNATTYSMTVIAGDAAGNHSLVSDALNVTTLDTQAPTIPTGLSSSNRSGSGFTLSWHSSTDNVGVTSYEVYLNGSYISSVTGTSAVINGLTNGTTYSVTVLAKDAAGNESLQSNTLNVATLDTESPDVPSGLTTSNVSGSGFTLSWTATHDNVAVSGYDVYRNGTFYSTVTGTSCVLTGLSNATTYSMRVLARDADGNISGLSNVLNVTTLDTQAPSIPAGLAASDITATSFTLSWTASTDNVSVASYSVYRNGTLYSTVSGTSATITGLTNGTSYGMSVLARDGSGNVSARSNTQNVTTLDTDPPSIPSSLAASNISGIGFTLTWAASTDNVGVSSYDVFINGSNYSTVTGTTINITGLSNVTTYSMSVKAKDATGNESALSNILNVTTLDSQPPTKPLSLSSSNRTGSSFTLSWSASSDNVGVTDYQVYRNGTQISIVTGTSAVISGLSNATTYSMTVIAGDAAGNHSIVSDALNVTTLDTQAPTIPTGLSSSNRSGSGFMVAWQASTDNVGVTSYEVYLNGSYISSVTGTSAVINGLTNGTTYSITVLAKDAAGNESLQSNTLNVATLDTESPDVPSGLTSSNISGSGFTLSWTATHDNVGVSGYDVYRNGTLYSTVTGTSCVLTGLTNATTYSMRVLARDAAGNVSGLSNVLNVTTLDTQAPSIPTGLAASNITGSSFTLSWTASTDNVSVANYSVYRNGTLYSTVSGTNATITGLTNGTTYGMSVLARDGSGNVSARSGTQNVTTLDTDPPSIPASLTASNISGTGFTLTWAASTDNVGVSGYDVFINGNKYTSNSGTTLNVSGLINGTAYIINILAKDLAGNNSNLSQNYNVRTIDTEAPAKPEALSYSQLSGNSFILQWGNAIDNVGTTKYLVYLNGNYYSSVSVNSALVTGLINATNYVMSVIAVDAAENKSLSSSSLQITTLDTDPPTIPAGLMVENSTGSSIHIKWSSSTDNVHVKNYLIYCNDTYVGLSTNNSYVINGLKNGTTFQIFIKASDDAGNLSGSSLVIPGTTLDTEAPSIPSNLVASNILSNSFVLSWNPSTDNKEVIIYDIFLNGKFINSTLNTSILLSGFEDGVSYDLIVKAKDEAGNSSLESNSLKVTTLDVHIPSAPLDLIAQDITGTEAKLSWSMATDNIGVTGYDIFVNGRKYDMVATTSAMIKDLTNATKYDVYLVARDAAGNLSQQSIPISFITLDTQAPDSPRNLATSNLTDTGFTLVWDKSEDNVGVVEYDIYKNGELIKSVTGTSIELFNLTNATTYQMRVVAKDLAGNLSKSDVIYYVKTLDSESPSSPKELVISNVNGTGFSLKWTPSSDNVGVSNYDIYLNGSLKSTSTTAGVEITGLQNITSYHVSIVARDSSGNLSSHSDELIVKTLDSSAPEIPKGINTQLVTNNSITLTWSESSDNVGVTNYDVYINDILAVSVTTTSAIITGLSANEKYNITIVARDAAGNNSSVSDVLIVYTLSTAIIEEEENKQIVIYPNPASEIIYLNLSEENLIQIYNISGTMVFVRKCFKGINQIPVMWSPGVYLIKIIASDGKETSQKVIIK